MTFSILHPSRSRPQKSFETIKKWILKAGLPKNELEIIVSVDTDDPQLSIYRHYYWDICIDFPFTFLVHDNRGAVEAINRAARIAQGRILIVVSDDTDPAVRWGERLLKLTEGKTDFVLKVRDGIQPKMITMPILDRTYFQRDGFIFNPVYDHCWADREFTEVAHKRKRVITKNIMFRHLHYSVLKNKKRDEQYARTDATFNKGKKIFLERQKINFGL